MAKRNAGYLFIVAAAFFALGGALQFVDARSVGIRTSLAVAYGICTVLYIVGAVSYLRGSKQ